MQPAQTLTSPIPLGNALRSRRLPKLAELLAVFIAPAFALLVTGRLAGDDVVIRGVGILIATAMMITAIWFAQRLRGETMADLGLTRPEFSVRGIGMGLLKSSLVLVVTVVLFVMAGNAMGLFLGTGTEPEVGGYDYLRGSIPALLGTLAAIYFSASFGEEVIYRGYLINRFEELVGGRFATIIAWLMAAVVFGLAHYTWGVVVIVQTTVMGLSLGAFYLRFGRKLWVNIFAHGYMDTLLFLSVYARLNAGA